MMRDGVCKFHYFHTTKVLFNLQVVKFLRERSADEERRRQKDLERQRGKINKEEKYVDVTSISPSEAQRRQEQQNQEKLQVARQRKAAEKQRRKEEWERRKAEEAQQAAIDQG